MSTSGAAGDGILAASATLNAAAIATMFTTPVQLVAAPGAGRALVIVAAVTEFVAGVDGFAGFPTPLIKYGNAAGQNSGAPLAEAFPAAAPPVSSVTPPLAASTVAIGNAGTFLRPAVENKSLVVTDAANPDRAGPIVTTTIAAAGAGYVVNDTGTIDADPNGYVGGATYRVSTVGALGIVTGLVITGAGDGYSTTSNPLPTTVGGAQPGVGTGLTVNVTAIAPADGALYVTVMYRVLTLH